MQQLFLPVNQKMFQKKDGFSFNTINVKHSPYANLHGKDSNSPAKAQENILLL